MATERGLSPISGPRTIYADLPPDANNDIADSILVGDMWVDVSSDTAYICVDNSLGAAVWDSMGGDVTSSSTTTLTNKSLVDNSTYIIDNSDNTKKAQFECSGITTGTTRTYTFPDANTTVVGHDTTATLTNKTISGSANTLSNIAVSSLAAGTDGELITWDSSGNPTTVAVGTATHVLTSNGAGAAPTFQASSGLTSITFPPRTGAYFIGTGTGSAGTGGVFGGNNMHCIPIFLSKDITYNRVGTHITTGFGSAAGVTFGIYDVITSSGLPNNLIVDFGAVDCTTSGEKVITISHTPTVTGWYFLALLNEKGGPLDFRSHGTIHGDIAGYSSGNGSIVVGVNVSRTYGSGLPDPFTGSPSWVGAGSSAPQAWMRRV